jgi:hypothetical protein
MSRWIFLKYQIFIIFSNRLLKIFKFKIVYWHMWHDQLDHIIWDGGSTLFLFTKIWIKSTCNTLLLVYMLGKDWDNFRLLNVSEIREWHYCCRRNWTTCELNCAAYYAPLTPDMKPLCLCMVLMTCLGPDTINNRTVNNA